MANTVTTPNMNLVLPVVGSDPSPDWATNLYNADIVIDQHNHTLGNGVQINVSGLNLTSDLTINNNNFTNARSLRFTPSSTPLSLVTDVGVVYVSGVDLWYNDTSGNQVRITSGGVVNATSSGISSGSATASFVSSVLVVNANSTTPANIQAASILLGNNVSGSHFLTLQPPSAMAANYVVTLPVLPAATNIMTLDTSGNMVATLNVDNSSVQITSSLIGIKPQGVLQTALAPRAISTTTGAIGSVVTSVSSGTFSTTSSSLTPVTNLTVTLTTSGRPVRVSLTSAGSTLANVETQSTGGTASAQVAFFNGATQITADSMLTSSNGATAVQINFPASAFSVLDTSVAGTAGTYTWTVQVSTSQLIGVSNCFLQAYEI